MNAVALNYTAWCKPTPNLLGYALGGCTLRVWLSGEEVLEGELDTVGYQLTRMGWGMVLSMAVDGDIVNVPMASSYMISLGHRGHHLIGHRMTPSIREKSREDGWNAWVCGVPNHNDLIYALQREAFMGFDCGDGVYTQGQILAVGRSSIYLGTGGVVKTHVLREHVVQYAERTQGF